MDTNLQPSSRVIFLYSLPKSVVEPMQFKGVDYNSVIKEIGDYDGVEVYDLNRDFFSKPHKCNILIILGEFLEYKNALLLQDDSIFPIADLVNLVSSSFREVNVIDCAWCYSGKGKTHNELKQRTHALVNTINGYTAVETRLALYWLMLKDNKLLGRENYKDSYDIKLSDLEAHQDSMDPKQLASLSEGTNLGTMATGERPFEVERGSTFEIIVIFHDENSEKTIEENIINAKNIPFKIKEPILNELEDGDAIYLDLHLESRYPEMTKYLKGDGEYSYIFNKTDAKSTISYECEVEAGFRLNSFRGILTLKIKNKPNPIDTWIFRIRVVPYIDEYVNNSISSKLPDNRNSNIVGPRVNLIRTPRTIPPKIEPKEQNKVSLDEKNVEEIVTDLFNGFAKQKVKEAVESFYYGSGARLALIEIVLCDHKLIKRRNSHKAFVKTLVAWGFLNVEDEEQIKKIISSVADKYKRIYGNESIKGYKDWNKALKDKKVCEDIGKLLGPTIPYHG